MRGSEQQVSRRNRRRSYCDLAHLTSALAFILLAGIGSMGCQPLVRAAIGVEEIEPGELQEALAGEPPPLILDVRQRDRFEAGHIPGAVSIDLESIDGYLSRRGPSRDMAVVTVCNNGNKSLGAAAMARAHGYDDVTSLEGGMRIWDERSLPSKRGAAELLDSSVVAPPVVTATELEQWLVVVAAFPVKSLYMLLSLLLILWLWSQVARDLKLIRFGLVSFLVGESFCTVHYIAGEGGTDFLEIGHQLGMVGASALIPWGIFHLIDRRVLRYSDPDATCAALRLCKQCWKRKEVSCGPHRVMLFTAPVLALVALMPLSIGLRPINVVTPVLGSDVRYHLSLYIQAAEFRVYPLLSALLLLVTFALLWRGRRAMAAAQAPFFVGLGFLVFALFRFFLLESYRSLPLWSDVWEETTELAAIAAVGLLLVVFRSQLGLRFPREASSGDGENR